MQRAIIQWKPATEPSALWLDFDRPARLIEAWTGADVLPALQALENTVRNGQAIAGYITYEAASGMDAALATHPRGPLPLLQFGVFPSFRVEKAFPVSAAPYHIGAWNPTYPRAAYTAAIQRIKEWIEQGHTYQVNHTFQLQARFSGAAAGWFNRLLQTQQAAYGAYVDAGDDVFCSVSPELFFALDRDSLTCRPMKGTARRGVTWHEDQAAKQVLAASTKNRAENLMIVDMMRNDLGRIARTGSVAVQQLFEIERYPTLLQMTSSITAQTDAGLAEIVQALFPCASITGAPKVRTMQLIRELEPVPRGIYTGAMGFVLPHHPLTQRSGRFGQFNVAIRTAHIRRRDQTVTYGTGGGIVWDSDAEHEYRECQTKALILTHTQPDFQLLETMRWTPARGIWFWPQHRQRLQQSSDYFGYRFCADTIARDLADATANLGRERHRVRLLLSASGEVAITATPVPTERSIWRVALSEHPVSSDDVFLYHKTTHRSVYDQALARHPGMDDVLLYNEAGQLTESCRANVVLRLDGCWYTPPARSGLLNGILRQHWLRKGWIQERTLTPDALQKADRILLLNALRGPIQAKLKPKM